MVLLITHVDRGWNLGLGHGVMLSFITREKLNSSQHVALWTVVLRQIQGNNPFCMAYRWMFFCVVEYDSGSVCNNLLLFCSFLEIISLTDAVFIFFISFHFSYSAFLRSIPGITFRYRTCHSKWDYNNKK